MAEPSHRAASLQRNDKIRSPATNNARQALREPKQTNYVYQPYYGYQSYYVVHRPRPTRQPTRKTTTQRYSIWQLSRKRRDVENDDQQKISQQKFPKKRQTNDNDFDYDYGSYTFPLFFGRERYYAPQKINRPYTMWDLTRR